MLLRVKLWTTAHCQFVADTDQTVPAKSAALSNLDRNTFKWMLLQYRHGTGVLQQNINKERVGDSSAILRYLV